MHPMLYYSCPCAVLLSLVPLVIVTGVCVPRKPLAVHECAAVGTPVRTLAVVEGGKFDNIMALSADKKWLVVALGHEGTLSVYSLPGGELVRTFGGMGDGPLQFKYLHRLCSCVG